MLDPANSAICNKSRQIGLSHTASAVGVIWGAMHGETTTIISVGELESREVLDKARKHSQVLCGLGSRMARPGRRNNDTELSFASGGRIIALPSTGGRSFSGNVFLDEFAYQPRAAKVWDAAAAVTMLGGRLRVISTPNGVGNDFEELWSKVKNGELKGWSPHEITLEDAMAQGYPVDLEKCWNQLAKGDPRLFAQLFRCQFLDNELQYIPSDLFARVFRERPSKDEGMCFGGLDIGETRDRTVLTILRRFGNERRLVHIESHKRTDDALLDDLVAKAFGPPYNCRRLAGDETGIGSMPAKRYRRQYGSRFEPVWFTNDVKEDLATGLYDVVSTENLIIPASYLFNGEDEIPLLQHDVYSIKRMVTEAGNVRYDAARTSKGHADRAWSLMLALHAAGRMSRMTAALQGKS